MDNFDDHAMKIIRSAFAKQILAATGINSPALEEAFSSVSREHYLGAPPWSIARYDGYLDVASKNPPVLYQDQLFALPTERKVNNGSPSLHAWGLNTLNVSRGDAVAHIGAGTGYYTALLSHLVGSSGRITAVEFDVELSSKAKKNLSHLSNVRVFQGTGKEWPIESVEAIYVNYACHRPAQAWLDALKPGGKLIFPLGFPGNRASLDRPANATGIFLLIERLASGYRARSLGPAYFVWGEGEPITPSAALRESLSRGDAVEIKSLRLGRQNGQEWFSDTDWGLSYEELG